MKPAATLCFCIIVVSSLLAQQPTEWRPNIAEDNKAATLSDTLDFMVNTIKNDGGNYPHKILRAEMLEGNTLHFVDRITDMRNFRSHCCDQGRYTVPVDDWKIKLANIDPLSVAVVRDQISFVVRFSGHNEGPIGSMGATVNEIAGVANYDKEAAKTDYPCADGVKHCKLEPESEIIHGSIPFKNDEIAKRFARALLHAAILCGGTKAVSPF
jgi:hypothetical protein